MNKKIITVRTRAEPHAVCGRSGVPRLSARHAEQRQDPAGVRRAAGGVQQQLVGHRHDDGHAPAGACRRHHPGPCRDLQVQARALHEHGFAQPGAVRRHVLSHRHGHGRQADRDQGGRRRRGDLRRQRRHSTCSTSRARDYHYFEGLTFRNTEIAIWAGTQRIVGRQGAHGEEEPFREHRHGRLHQPCALEQLLHRRQLVHRPQPHRLPDQLVGRLVRQLPGRRLPAFRRRAFATTRRCPTTRSGARTSR